VAVQLNDTLGVTLSCEREDFVLDADIRARTTQVIDRLLGASDGVGQIGSVKM
jgi:hypothetical protein